MNTVYHNAKIYIERARFAEAMLVTDGQIAKIGTYEEVTQGLCHGHEAHLVDLQGRTVIPGFNDSHCHALNTGKSLSIVRLGGCRSMQEIIEKGREFMASHPMQPGDVLSGRGWNQDYFTDGVRMPTRHDLDKITTEYPVVYTRACGHILVCNTKALEVAGITRDTPDIPGGEIYKDENGEPNGLFSENARRPVQAIVPGDTAESLARQLRTAMDYAAGLGITTLQTCDIGREEGDQVEKAYALAYNDNPKAIRTYIQCSFSDTEEYSAFLAKGHKTGTGNDMTRFGPLKMFVDGSLGARTALMRQPYADDPTTKGVPTMTVENFEAMVRLADENGCQVAVHAIGDGAAEMVLNAYDKVIGPEGNKNRHAVIHCQITDNDMLRRFKDKDILAQVQPIFIHYDMNVVAQRCGEELAATSYAFGDLYRMGVHTSFGTDSPVEDLNPFENMYCAVTRKRLDGARTYRPDQCVDIYDAVDQYTIGSAYVSFDEDRLGRLMPGYLADFAVLDRDIFTIPSDEIKDAQCLMTVVGGNVVFER